MNMHQEAHMPPQHGALANIARASRAVVTVGRPVHSAGPYQLALDSTRKTKEIYFELRSRIRSQMPAHPRSCGSPIPRPH
uniref:Uncharacterized protein n=1 Tax=Steinernema glaseri TaxID=37863 RepID=A0A1I7YSF2_9BILA